VQSGEDFSNVIGGTDQELDTCCETSAVHQNDSDGGFGIGLGFVRDEEVGGVLLGGEAGGEVVSVAHVLAVVEEDHAGFERHFVNLLI
jgi:hypothetical protein